ncbi:MAG TPA: hypothetical protein VFV71_07825 [Burkholderiales bacterium]|nr:hypothetical protein [Burkholderiales bacterium]
MGKKSARKADAGDKPGKRGKKKKYHASAIEDALSCPPTAKFFHELVVGNGIGEHAVEDAAEAYRKAWDSRREKALEAAQAHRPDNEKDCGKSEHLILGPFFGPQSWRVEGDDPQRATTWSWLGFQSVHFCRRN